MMSIDAYTMMMMIIMPRMILEGLMSSRCRYGQLARLWWVQRGANRLEIHALMCELCVGKYYKFNFILTGGHPYDGLTIGP